MNPIVRAVLEIANRIQGPNLAFDRHPEGGVAPAFPERVDLNEFMLYADGEGNLYSADPLDFDGTVFAHGGPNAGHWVEWAPGLTFVRYASAKEIFELGATQEEPEVTTFVDDEGYEWTGTVG